MPRLKKLEKSQGAEKAQQIMADLEGKKMLLNIFRSMANSPAALDGFLKFSGALREGKLDGKAREAIALAVGQVNKCEYCLSAHTMLGKNAGLDETAVRDARLGKSSDKKLHAMVTLAKKLAAEQGRISDAEISAARAAGLDDAEITEVVANVALNIYTNYFNNMNQTEVDLPKVPVEVG
ncbi:MAG: carboxymuconolactone decarboxylase family protein [Planctomycetota bacterium]|nr:carboxymuconolactone decarboxylase family protein [Planctomycetota bacterium]